MNPLKIGRQRFSKIFWDIVDEKVSDYPHEMIEKIIEDQQKLRAEANYNTGSVPFDDAVELYKLVKFFKPRMIAEVGTFIGVSTKVMDEALKDDFHRIFTCDSSNDIQIYKDNKHIIQYPKQTSTHMFRDLADKNLGIDLIYLDGRIQEEDFQYLPNIIHDHTIFVFDDFEGIEKGTVNAMRLESGTRVLIYPREGRKTAVSLPFTMLHFVAQEPT